jgi:hypothetical protein
MHSGALTSLSVVRRHLRGNKRCIQFRWGNQRERDNLEVIDVDGSKKLNWSFKNVWRGWDLSGSG